MLSGEYFVIDGALSLALPCRLGQQLQITTEANAAPVIDWISRDERSEVWFSAQLTSSDFTLLHTSDAAIATTLQQLLRECRRQNPDFLKNAPTLRAETSLDFPRDWGLGTSSTLLYMLAEWSKVDPFVLLEKTMGGSGYDIACASANGPILYQKHDGKIAVTDGVFQAPFREQLYFVYLGKKQNSREGIRHYRERGVLREGIFAEVTALTEAMLSCQTIEAFEQILMEHERLVGETLGLPQAKTLYFADFPGAIKSLGAWGGDFVLVATRLEERSCKDYFQQKGYSVVLKYDELVLDKPSSNE